MSKIMAFPDVHVHTMVLIEESNKMSPYIYHINDILSDNKFYIINDKKILNKIVKKATSSSTSLEENNVEDLERARLQELANAILREIDAIRTTYTKQAGLVNGSSSSASSLAKRGAVVIDEALRDAKREVFILITTLYDADLIKYLIESDCSIEAIIKLVNDSAMEEQKEFDEFYNEYITDYPFRNKLKKNASLKPAGMYSKHTPNNLGEEIAKFWKKIERAYKEHPYTFRNTIFCDCAIPHFEIHDHVSLKAALISYRSLLHEDVRNVQRNIADIVEAYECFNKKCIIQNMRTLNRIQIDELAVYKQASARSNKTIPCIVDSIVEQVMTSTMRNTDNRENKHTLSNEFLEGHNENMKELLSFLRDLIREKYSAFDDTDNRGVFYEGNIAKLKRLLNNDSHSWDTTIEMLSIFIKTYVKIPSSTAENAQMIKKLKDYVREKNNCAALQKYSRQYYQEELRSLEINPFKILSYCENNVWNQRHIIKIKNDSSLRTNTCRKHNSLESPLSYYVNLTQLVFREKYCEPHENQKKINNRILFNNEKTKINNTVLSSGILDKIRETLIELRELQNDIEIDHGPSYNKYLSGESMANGQTQDSSTYNFKTNAHSNSSNFSIRRPLFDGVYRTKLKQTLSRIKDTIKNSEAIQHVASNYAYIEQYAPDTFVQLIFNTIMTYDNVNIMPSDVTDDVLLICSNNKYMTVAWSFRINTVVGLHDFYHHLEPDNEQDYDCSTLESNRSGDAFVKFCANEIFVLKDSIKYEQTLAAGMNSTDADGIETEIESEVSEESFDSVHKQLKYKYGIPQLIENNGSTRIQTFDRNTRVNIERSEWLHKNIEHIKIELNWVPYNICFDNNEAHTAYYHVGIDSIRSSLSYCEFHIKLAKGLLIYFKKNVQQAQSENVSEINDESNNEEQTDLASDPSSVIYEENIHLFQKFTKTSAPYFPIISYPNGLTIEISNDTCYPFCVQQYHIAQESSPKRVRKYLPNAAVMINNQDETVVLNSLGEITIFQLSEDKSIKEYKTISPNGDIESKQIKNGETILLEKSSMKILKRRNFEDNSLAIIREDGTRMDFTSDGGLHVTYPDGTLISTCVTVEEDLVYAWDGNATSQTHSETNTEVVEDKTELATESDVEDNRAELDGFVVVNISVEIRHKNYWTLCYNYKEEIISMHGLNGVHLTFNTNGTCCLRKENEFSMIVGTDHIVWVTHRISDTEYKTLANNINTFKQFEFLLSPDSLQSDLITLTKHSESKININCKGDVMNVLDERDDTSNTESDTDWKLNNKYDTEKTDYDTESNEFLETRFFVIHPDCSGFEILSTNDVEAYIAKLKCQQEKSSHVVVKAGTGPLDQIIVRELDFVYPYYSKLIFKILSADTIAEHVQEPKPDEKATSSNTSHASLMETVEELYRELSKDILALPTCEHTNHRRSKQFPSTYGPKWSHPFQTKPLPIITEGKQSYISYRAINRVHTSVEKTFQCLFEAMNEDETENSTNVDDHDVAEKFSNNSSEDSEYNHEAKSEVCLKRRTDSHVGVIGDVDDVIEQIQKGNLYLKVITPDIEDYIGTCVHHMIASSIRQANIKEIKKRSEEMLTFLACTKTKTIGPSKQDGLGSKCKPIKWINWS